MFEITFYLSVLLILIGVFIYIKGKKKKVLNDPTYINTYNATQNFMKEIERQKETYFRYSTNKQLKKEYRDHYSVLQSNPNFVKVNEDGIFIEFQNIYPNLDRYVREWNEQYIARELEENKGFLSNIDGKSLDNQQRRAVVTDEDNNLVIAGAGSGKTLTITGKVKYLVEKKNVNAEEILLISFTKKAAAEMQNRISNKLRIGVEAKTFHKFGLEIIGKSYGYKPDIFNEISKIINKYFTEEILEDKKEMTQIITYFGYYLNIPKELEEFENLGEAHDFYRNVDFETLKSKVFNKTNELKREKVTIQGERVKSIEEVIIANFLYLNGINYEYESLYPFPSDDPYRKRYRPDFYLPDYDLYLEHFGITEDYRTPWLSAIEERKYIEGIEWKRKFHKKNNTRLLETYSYLNKKGRLLVELERILKANKVAFLNIDYAQVYQELFIDNKDRYFSEFKILIRTFIGLFKSKGYSVDMFNQMRKNLEKNDNIFLRNRTDLFISIVKPIFERYQDYLIDTQQIDFNDMINLATEIVANGEASLNYKYIIIDEYQDISMSRFKLIKEIKNQTNAKLLCVGDDWQSIYRFAGSEIDLFTNFRNYFGYSELLKIEKIYRNSQELIDVAGKFIMLNPKQIKKALHSGKHHSNPVRIITYDRGNEVNYLNSIEKAIDEIVYLHGENTEIMVLGRNNFDRNIFKKGKDDTDDKVRTQKDKYSVTENDDEVIIHFKKYPELKMFFLTVHRSKGLEAGNVIIINLENRLVGFPNKISDDPILSLVLTDVDTHSYAEERRLFYVALTRTKNSTYLVAPDYGQSVFVDELIKKQGIKYETVVQGKSSLDNPGCPKCQKGHLILRENTNNKSKFLGCSNYPLCENTFKNVELLNDYVTCPKCSGYMVKRNGKYGEFYGCTNYPFCSNILNIQKSNDNFNHNY